MEEAGRKRTRVVESDNEGSENIDPLTNLSNQESIYSEYKDGSIVRIKLTNFVTYDKVECRPGPNLNMIIGPNGTGKSTIVCGIALGLGGKPDLLGRAKKLHDFIKHGEDVAMIEVELKAESGNVTITRVIDKRTSGSSSVWKINHKKATESAVLNLIQKLNAQVDNLCSFLPQDKVCEFAQLSPQELLKETERAIGNEDLLGSHERLIFIKSEEKRIQDLLSDQAKRMNVMISKLNELESQVQRHEERRGYLHQSKLIEGMIPFLEFDALQSQYKEKKQQREQKLGELGQQKETFQPLMEKLRRLKTEHAEFEAAGLKLKADNRQSTDLLRRSLEEDFQGCESRTDEYRERLSMFDEKVQVSHRSMQTAEKGVRKIESELGFLRQRLCENGLMNENGDMNENVDIKGETAGAKGELLAVEAGIKEAGASLMQLKTESRRLKDEKEQVQQESNALASAKADAENKLKRLHDRENRKLDLLERSAKPVVQAHQWLVRHQSDFQQEIYGPICLTINVKNPKYAMAVETQIGFQTLTTFVTLCKADYDKLNHEFQEVHGFRVNVVMFSHRRLEEFKSQISNEELRRLGFECQVLDLIEGPREVLSALCQLSQVHQTPVTLTEIDLNQLEKDDRVFNCISGHMRHQISRRYGTTSTRSQKLKPAQLLTFSVDANEVQELEGNVSRIEKKLNEQQKKLQALAHDEQGLQSVFAENERQKQVLMEKRRQILKLRTDYVSKTKVLDAVRFDYAALVKKHDDLGEDRRRLEEALQSEMKRKVAIAQTCLGIQEKAVRVLRDRTLLCLETLQIQVKMDRLARHKKKMEQATSELELECVRLERDTKDLKAATKQAQQKTLQLFSQFSDAEKQEMQAKYEHCSLDALLDLQATLKAKAEHCPSVSQQVLQDYETKKRIVGELQENVDSSEQTRLEMQHQMDAIKAAWHPKLLQLVAQINSSFASAFARIGCAGEVKLHEEDDFHRWGIQILVKFRDHEKLQPLTGHRQSGGERSVSTVLYLMSLQSLSKTPFRVVDEINQGMDPKNERMIHGQIVNVACQPNTSQYFLITPKLLADLKYNERMRVLCIFNGENQPEQFDLKSFLN